MNSTTGDMQYFFDDVVGAAHLGCVKLVRPADDSEAIKLKNSPKVSIDNIIPLKNGCPANNRLYLYSALSVLLFSLRLQPFR